MGFPQVKVGSLGDSSTSSDTTTGCSPSIWADFPTLELLHDPGKGVHMFDDFSGQGAMTATGDTVGHWVVTSDGGTAASISGAETNLDEGPCASYLKLDTGSTDNNEITMTWGKGACFMISDAAAEESKLWFEVRFAIETIADDDTGFFIGLAEEGLGADFIADAGTLADKDFIGVFRPEGDGDGLDLVHNIESGGGVVTHKADWQTLVAVTFYKFGFVYDPNDVNKTDGTNYDRVVPYWNGVPDRANGMDAADIAASDFPDSEYLTPIIATKINSTTPVSLYIDWIRCGQLRVS
jgi:hypothetical protein